MLFNISSMIQKQTSYSSSYKNLVSLFSPIIFLQISRMTYEEKFKKLVREMHQYIKAYHHLTNVHISDGTTQEPLGMVRTMRRLESVIKPAVPTVTTNLMLYGNARNWLHTGLQMLEDHYEKTLKETETNIKQLTVHEWKKALKVAIQWSQRNLREASRIVLSLILLRIAKLVLGDIDPIPVQNTPEGTEMIVRPILNLPQSTLNPPQPTLNPPEPTRNSFQPILNSSQPSQSQPTLNSFQTILNLPLSTPNPPQPSVLPPQPTLTPSKPSNIPLHILPKNQLPNKPHQSA